MEFVQGKAKEYIATRDFALNFDDPKITPSTKIKEGKIVLYDGINATYDRDGILITGRCSSLKSAISNAQWLVPRRPDLETTDEFSTLINVAEDPNKSILEIAKLPKNYDNIRGGSFDSYTTTNDGIYVAPTKKSNIIKEQDLIVKEIPLIKESKKEQKTKHEIAGDQVAVKNVGPIIVNSSTAVGRRQQKRNPKIIRADEMGSEGTIPLSSAKSTEKPKKKSSYIIDNSTPRTIREDMTIEEIQKITKVINADESQDAKVVKTIKKSPEIQEIDGIILRKIESPKDISLKKVESPKEMTITTKVSSSSIHVEDAIQVQKQLSPDAIKRSAEKAETRKKASIQTQTLIEKEKISPMSDQELNVIEESLGQKISAQKQSNLDDYLSMLPDNWGSMHWVQKEKFIKELNNINFIKFILSVEAIKAVQKACSERLIELGQKMDS